jgi:predicted transcriptional regulator
MTKTDPTARWAKHRMFCRLKARELAIMRVLWDAGTGRTIRQVFEELYSRGPWSYNTVKTTVGKLARRNALKHHRSRSGNVYVPTADREAVAAACVQQIISEIVGGSLEDGVLSVLGQLPLSAAELRTIRESLHGC